MKQSRKAWKEKEIGDCDVSFNSRRSSSTPLFLAVTPASSDEQFQLVSKGDKRRFVILTIIKYVLRSILRLLIARRTLKNSSCLCVIIKTLPSDYDFTCLNEVFRYL